LRQAVRWKLLLENPAQDVHLPRQARRHLIVLDVEQSRQFIAAISGHEHEALFALAITTGMRPSEYLALTWSDLDLEHGAVSISETIEWRGREWLFEDTKRERSRRVVKLQNWVTALLGRLKKKASLADMRPGDFVFKSHRGGPIREPKLVGRHFKPLLELAGLPNIRL
jgi:integrase